MEKQLNVWIAEDLKDALTERALQEKTTLRDVVEGILQQDIARARGEEIQQQALPVLRDLMQTEVRKGFAQLRNDLREDLEIEILEEMRNLTRTSESRLARLIVRVARDTGVLRRFLYALVARLVDLEFAQEAYEDAKAKTAHELSARSSAKKEATES